MAKEFAKAFYKSKQWQQCRAGYIESVHGLCERCMKRGTIRPGKIVHHTVPLTSQNINDSMISLNWDLLEYDCQDCHNQEHHRNNYKVTREGLMFDEDGNIIPVSPPIK